jgi:hypothetical protein
MLTTKVCQASLQMFIIPLWMLLLLCSRFMTEINGTVSEEETAAIAKTVLNLFSKPFDNLLRKRQIKNFCTIHQFVCTVLWLWISV